MELHPAWEFRTVDGIGHLLPLESPQMYVELVVDWMGGGSERALGRAVPSHDALDPLMPVKIPKRLRKRGPCLRRELGGRRQRSAERLARRLDRLRRDAVGQALVE